MALPIPEFASTVRRPPRVRPGAEDPEPADPPKPEAEPEAKSEDEPEKVTPDDDWKAKSRKNEAAAKRERKERERLEAELQKLRDKDKSDHERAIEKARAEARTEALSEAEKERRSDRLEVAVTRLATKGIRVGEGEDAETIRFADADDALLRVERAVRRGEIDADEIYDGEGKVKNAELVDALREIAADNPHLVADGERPAPKGDPDTNKGGPAEDLDAMTAEDHFQAIRRRK